MARSISATPFLPPPLARPHPQHTLLRRDLVGTSRAAAPHPPHAPRPERPLHAVRVRHAGPRQYTLSRVWTQWNRRLGERSETPRHTHRSTAVRYASKLRGVIALILAGITTTSLVALLGTIIYPRDRSKSWHVDNSLNWRLSNPFWRMSAVFVFESNQDGLWNEGPSALWRASRTQEYLVGHGQWGAPNPRVARKTWFIHEAGWPMKASWGWECRTHLIGPKSYTQGHVATVPVRRKSVKGFDTGAFPIRPLWIGFTVNSGFYAALWYGLYSIPVTIRRRLRVRRGLCPSCAYDMRGLVNTPCPECGLAPRSNGSTPSTPIALDRGR